MTKNPPTATTRTHHPSATAPLTQMKFLETTLTNGYLAASPHNPRTPTTFPTNIHLDLPIPDPHLGFNERTTQWVHEHTWVYTTTFTSPAKLPVGAKTCLVFEGLDTFATVSLNGTKILESQNMFRSYRVDITGFVRKGENEVVMDFKSALREGDRIMAENGGERVTWNGHYSRVFVRKAQYHYGWDWGPSLITCGPWKPIRLQTYTDRISSTDFKQFIGDDLSTAILSLTATTETLATPEAYTLAATILSPSGQQIHLNLAQTSRKTWEATQTLISPELWYPYQHGPQNLYTVTFTLSTTTGVMLDTTHKRIGLRRVRLIQDPLPQLPDAPVSGGTSFYFNVNNTPLFIGGSNWIPAHSFLSAVRNSTLQSLMHLLRDRGNQNMLRIWGGGVYESEELYTLCDELGILVWQDICLACGDYPAQLDTFVAEISSEVRENLARLKHHPSLVVVAGNNEDYQVADEELGYDAGQPKDEWRASRFPGRWLYEKVFPEIVRGLCDTDVEGVLYWPGSPWGGEDSTDRTVGDVHQWNVWGGIQAPYQRYPDLGGRFISEFGMPSYPSLQTIKRGFLDPTIPFSESVARGDWNPEAEIIEHHMKAHSFQKRLLAYIGENFRVIDGSIEERVYLSQLLQSEAMNYAYRGWRRRWASRECGGALVWQLNDVWPVTSWSIIDFHLHPKPAFYTIARSLAPITPIITRTSTDPKPNSKLEALVNSKTTRGAGNHSLHSTPHIYPPKKSTIDIVVSSTQASATTSLTAEVRTINITTGSATPLRRRDLSVPPNGAVEVLVNAPVDEESPTAVQVLLWSDSGELLARETDWPQPLKYCIFAERGVSMQWNVDGGEVKVSAEKPVKGLVFEEVEGVVWSDNCIDVMPGDVQIVKVTGLRGQKVSWRWYGMSKEEREGAVF